MGFVPAEIPKEVERDIERELMSSEGMSEKAKRIWSICERAQHKSFEAQLLPPEE